MSTESSSPAPAPSSTPATVTPPTDPKEVLNVNVGVLGHVDSGKTSLVKTLSTLLSTAALDKSKQSRERGMTLDLGFSCFFLEMPEQLAKIYPEKKKLQITLVDCPGHASLIRTIIGGAQIIDMVLLVVDAYKGWQAQTTECLVLAELTSPHLVVALNKVDMFPIEEREEQITKAKNKVKQRLQHTRFKNAPMVGIAACVGGEKVAAVNIDELGSNATSSGGAGGGGGDNGGTNNSKSPAKKNNNSSTATDASTSNETTAPPLDTTYNVNVLIEVLRNTLPPPKRTITNSSNNNDAFYFSIDHCFPIKGMGTVLTGTVLNGSTSVNDIIEFPTLGKLERKIKSMQMFKRKVKTIQQGDRAGICVSSLDAKLLERGVAAAPNAVQLLKGAIALVRKIKYYPTQLPKGKSKFHISVGHTTIMANVSFWGAREIRIEQQKRQQKKQDDPEPNKEDNDNTGSNDAALNKKKTADDKAKKATTKTVETSSLGGDADRAGLPFLNFDFDQDFIHQDGYLESLDSDGTKGNNNSKKDDDDGLPLHWALLEFQTPVYCPLNSLVIGSRLDTVDTNSNNHATGTASSCRLAFSGRLIQKIDPEKDISKIRLYTPKEKRGVISRLGDPHRRQDDNAVVRYEVFGGDLFKKETVMKPFVGMKVITEKTRDMGEIKSSFGTSGKFRVWFPAGTTAREGEGLLLPFKRFAHDPQKAMRQDDLILPASRPGTRIEATPKKGKNKGSNKPPPPEAVGEVSALKGDILEKNGKHTMAIIAGLFTPEINIREEKVGRKVIIPSTNEHGTIVGPFGKAGKCKVSFENGISAEVGAKAELPPT